MGSVATYVVEDERFPRISRSDGIVQMLVPVPHCQYCYKPISKDYETRRICYDCHKEPTLRERLPDRLVAATLYIPEVKGGYEHNHEIIELKERGRFAKEYAEVLVHVLTREDIDVSDGVIVPIPQTKAREGRTGPLALADSLSGLTHLPVSECLSFNRFVRSQKKLHKSDREDNMVGAMTAERWGDNGRVVLVDEIMTSGATIREATRAIRAAGARDTIGVIAARDAGIRSLEHAGVLRLVED